MCLEAPVMVTLPSSEQQFKSFSPLSQVPNAIHALKISWDKI